MEGLRSEALRCISKDFARRALGYFILAVTTLPSRSNVCYLHWLLVKPSPRIVNDFINYSFTSPCPVEQLRTEKKINTQDEGEKNDPGPIFVIYTLSRDMGRISVFSNSPKCLPSWFSFRSDRAWIGPACLSVCFRLLLDTPPLPAQPNPPNPTLNQSIPFLLSCALLHTLSDTGYYL